MTELSGGRIALLGQGLLHDAIAAALADRVLLLGPHGDAGNGGQAAAAGGAAVPHVDMFVLVSDGWDTRHHEAVRKRARDSTAAWLPVRTELGRVVIGPVERPGTPGCVDCAERRRWRNRDDRDEVAAVRRRHEPVLAEQPSPWLTGLGAGLVGDLVAADVARLSEVDAMRTGGAVLLVDLSELSVSRHPYLADPACRVCGGMPDDSPGAARLELVSRPAHSPGSFRYRDLEVEFESLVDTYVDEQTGVVKAIHTWDDSGLVVAAAPVTLRNGHEEAGYGRTTDLRASRMTALLEALERYGSAPGGRRTVVAASYSELGDRALDPRRLGLHPAEQHRLAGFELRPFDTNAPYRWVWGWSFARQEPILVPEQVAYYATPHRDGGEERFIYEISNGCALGTCLEEAILYGLLEVAERDAFLLTWHARLPAPRIDLSGVADRRVALLAAVVGAESGYQVSVFDITVEQGIPCVWALATNPRDDGRPALACAAGSHPSPERAIRSALSELAGSLGHLTRIYAEQAQADRARRLVHDSALVTRMEDHPLLYADPGAATRLDFLTGSQATRAVADIGRTGGGGLLSDDLRDNLREVVDRYTSRDLDVIVVDQTSAEHAAGGLHCVKVLIPGTLPMTFGHRFRRVDGLPRLRDVPRLLGYRDRPLRPEEINPHPHPFP